ncbi:MAG: 5-(carboxyamino)imidazole ribonucleotide mutase [Rectinemataceae bacterium]|nr:5-(carboxyamino)imidazole ribonucleotide mutase [Rectinemataceae bacterium]
MKKNLAYIVMGAKSDYPHVERIIEWLDYFGIAHETSIASAHKTPEKLLAIIHDQEKKGDNVVYITIAGLSNALSGMVDFSTTFPVIACPPPCDAFGGADIFSSLRMPPGVAAATVLDPRNAAMFAAKIFAASDDNLKIKLGAYHAEQRDKIDRDEISLAEETHKVGASK